MAIKIIKKHEPIEVRQVKFTIFGDAGSGKSTFAMTAADCLIFDFDDAGSARALGNVDRIIINHWNEVDDHRREDFAPYKTLGIDTVGGAVDRLSAYLIELDPKLADPLTGGLTQRGYGALRHKFAKWLKRLISYGLDVVLIAHVTEDKNQDARIVRLDVAGQSKNFIHKISDQMGYLSMNEKGERWLNCSPALNTLGKNTAEIPPYQIKSPLVEPDMLAKLITITKDRMNEKQAAKTEDAGRAEKFRELAKEREMGDADFFNALVEEVKGKDVNPYLKRVVKDLAKANGLVWSKAEDKYVISVDKEAETAPAKTDEKPPPPGRGQICGAHPR